MRAQVTALRWAAAGALITIIVAASCGASASNERAVDPPGTITIEMGSFFFKPATITLKAGERMTLRFRNSSALPHDFLVGRQVKGPDSAYAEDFFKGVTVKATGGTFGPQQAYGGTSRLEVAALGIAQLSFTVPNATGTFEMGCFLPGHYQAGMKGTVIVE